jgi:hypothetical protein
VHSEDDVVVLCPLSRKLYCIRIKMSLEARIGAGSLERPLASLGAISFNPLAFPVTFTYSLPLFSGYINYHDSVNVLPKLVTEKNILWCLLFTVYVARGLPRYDDQIATPPLMFH